MSRILKRVVSRRKIGLSGLAALAFLPGMLHAELAPQEAFAGGGGSVYAIHLSASQPLAKIELSVMLPSTEWEVWATYDSALCEIHCVSRRKRNAFGQTPLIALLLPPTAAIRIYTDFVSPPLTVTVDPAGLGLPDAKTDVPLTIDPIFIPARKLLAVVLARMQTSNGSNGPRLYFSSSAAEPQVSFSASLPLRI